MADINAPGYMLSTAQVPLRERLKSVPTPLGGLGLATASLGGTWALYAPRFAEQSKLLAALIGGLFILLVVSKFVVNSKLLKEDISHPVAGSIMPTIAMGTMVVAAALLPYVPVFARGLWLTAIVAHVALLFFFAVYRIREFRMEHMVPSWFVPPVGIIVAAVTCKGMGYDALVHAIFYFGLVAYLIKLPLMMYRLIFKDCIPQAALPTIAIMGAPASLTLAGYLAAFEEPNLILVGALVPLALFMTMLVYVAFFKLLRLPFSPGYAAFTFPMVIGATAMFKFAALIQSEVPAHIYHLFYGVAVFEMYIASAIVFYVALRYGMHYLIRR
ncbi:TDT family transporter [Kistimonas scapharcae]|uniref:TDT family transporter n=1 Tax=Kistimonas scapharcae TaxID=1036133 RepID=A0ABP8UW22_9GAMM